MSEPKSNSDETRTVFLSLHLAGDSSFEREKEEVEAQLRDHFENAFTLDHEDPDGLQDRELVYSVRLKWTEDTLTRQATFQDLSALIKKLESHTPAFTQGSEALS